MLSWIKRFNIFCLLDSQHYHLEPHRYDLVAGAGARKTFSTAESFDGINDLIKGEWTFGHLSYELGAGWQIGEIAKRDKLGFPLFYFFIPEHVMVLQKGTLTVTSPDPDETYEQLMQAEEHQSSFTEADLHGRLSKSEYLEKIRALQAHIKRGDCYEINFCQEFFAENAKVDPVDLYRSLSLLSPNPFSGFYRVNDSYLVCASPERFLLKEGNEISSQPMKGTAARSDDPEADERSMQQLRESAKETAENVMVVDLVRNDLSRFCVEGSVVVEELFGIYSFPNVHQMVSTVKGKLKPNVYFSHIIRSAFPMGSMTGAPKKRVVELIDRYEPVARGIFSGTIGYINPEGDLDLNVVIRSLMYNAADKYLSYQVGSGITFYSDPEKEWDECQLKAMAIKKVLTSGQHSG